MAGSLQYPFNMVGMLQLGAASLPQVYLLLKNPFNFERMALKLSERLTDVDLS